MTDDPVVLILRLVIILFAVSFSIVLADVSRGWWERRRR